MYHEKNDKELLDLLKSGRNDTLLSFLFEKYRHLVFGVCMKYLKNEARAKDLVSEVYEHLIGSDMSGVEEFSTWIYVVTKNKCLMSIRSEEAKEKREEKYVRMNSEPNEHSVEELNWKASVVERAIAKLSPPQSKCIELFYLEEKSYKEVSELSGYSLLEVKSHIQNGKRNLKQILLKLMS
ncbi:MAG: sigma-70 family RNA polymerase sigma factor [Flavobacteriales bacterium]